MKPRGELAPEIRKYVVEKYVEPARRQGKRRFSIRVGDVRKGLGPRYQERTPAVSNALRAQKFLNEHGLRLVEISGPPSGQSTTVEYTYEFAELQDSAGRPHPLDLLRGAWRDIFEALGGGENFIKSERTHFLDRDFEVPK